MICPACGHPNEADAKFCNMCGVRVAPATARGPGSAVPPPKGSQPLGRLEFTPPPATPPRPERSSGSERRDIRPLIRPTEQEPDRPFYRKWWFWLLAVLLAVAVTVIAFSMQNNRFELMQRPSAMQGEPETPGPGPGG